MSGIPLVPGYGYKESRKGMETQNRVNPRNGYKKHSLEGGKGGGLGERMVSKLSQGRNVNTAACGHLWCAGRKERGREDRKQRAH